MRRRPCRGRGSSREGLAAALHREDELGDRSVGNRGEGRPDPAVDRVDPPDQVDLNRLRGGAPERRDEIGQRVAGGAQVDRAFDRVVEQRGDRPRVSVDRARGALVGGELDPGADRPDVFLLEGTLAGRVTAALRMLDSPSGSWVRVAVNAGWPQTLGGAPSGFVVSFGLKSSVLQFATWKCMPGSAIAPWSPVSLLVTRTGRSSSGSG